MNAIFLGKPDIVERVYPTHIKSVLQKEALLKEPCIEWPQDGNLNGKFTETKYIFSTWGMPSLSVLDIKREFPALEAVFYAAGTVQQFARPFLECGVRIFSAWSANAIPVAEYTLAQILLAGKNFFSSSRHYTPGRFNAARAISTRVDGNYNCKIGIIGAGMIGKLVIKMLKNHVMDVMVFDPFLPDEKAEELGVTKVSLDTLFRECRVISNHLANNAQTRGMLNYPLFAAMPSDGCFINTGRGAQVVEDDLCRVLSQREDITAILDVTCPEPVEENHPFFSLPNVILTPHIAGSQGREVERMAVYMLEEFRRFITNEPCLYEVQEKMLETMA